MGVSVGHRGAGNGIPILKELRFLRLWVRLPFGPFGSIAQWQSAGFFRGFDSLVIIG